MNRTKLAVGGLIALLAVGIGFAIFLRSTGSMQVPRTTPPPAQGTPEASPARPETALEQLSREYQGYTGEDYDRLFIANMIAHHQGAVDMATLAQQRAAHQELKQLATAIVTDQSREIEQLLAWQRQWGYPPTSGANMVEHSAMGMSDEMARMGSELAGTTGDEFDRAFLELMIEHHRSAIAMAQPGASNAHHEEIKQLSGAITAAQSNEITRMQQWQRDWGYVQ